MATQQELNEEIKRELAALRAASASFLESIHASVYNVQNLHATQEKITKLLRSLHSIIGEFAQQPPPADFGDKFDAWKSNIASLNNMLTEIVTKTGSINLTAVRSNIDVLKENIEKLQPDVTRKREAVTEQQKIITAMDTLQVDKTHPDYVAAQAKMADLVKELNLLQVSLAANRKSWALLNDLQEQAIKQQQLQILKQQQLHRSIDSLVPGYQEQKSNFERMGLLFDKSIPLGIRVVGGFNMVAEGALKVATAMSSLMNSLYSFSREYSQPFNQVVSFYTEGIVESFRSFGEELSFTASDYRRAVLQEQKVIGGRLEPEETRRMIPEAQAMGVDVGQLFGAAFSTYGLIGRSIKDSEAGVKTVAERWGRMGLTAEKSFEYMRQNAFLVAIYGERFTKSIGDSVAKFAKMGLDMQLFRNMSEAIVQDFGGFIDKTAELGATIPGIQLDVATLSQKAFLGGPVAVADELQAQLGAIGKNFADLPYFQQVSLKQTFGLDEASLAKLMGKTPLEEIPLKQVKIGEETNNWLQKIFNWVSKYTGPMGSFAEVFGPVLSALQSIASTLLAWKAVGLLGKIAAGGATTASIGSTVGTTGAVAAGAAGTSLLAKAGGWGKAAVTKFGPAALMYAGGEGLNWLGDQADEAGYEKLGAVSRVGGSALKGAGVAGALTGYNPWAMAGGAVVGGGYQGYKEREVLFGSKPNQIHTQLDTSTVNLTQSAGAPAASTVYSPRQEGPSRSIFDGVVQRTDTKPTPLPKYGYELGNPNAQRDSVVERVAPPMGAEKSSGPSWLERKGIIDYNAEPSKPIGSPYQMAQPVKPLGTTSQTDFKPVIDAIKALGEKIGSTKELGDRIASMKMQGDVIIDGYRLNTYLADLKETSPQALG